MESKAQGTLKKRDKEERTLVVEQDQLKAKLKTVEAQIEENQVCKEQLLAIVAICKKIKLLPGARKATVFVSKNVEQKLKEMTEEAKIADQFLDSVFTHPV